MAGQRYATTTIVSITPQPGDYIQLYLAGVLLSFSPVAATTTGAGTPGQYIIAAGGDAGAREFNGAQLANEIRRVLSLPNVGLDGRYLVTARFSEFQVSFITITATSYDPQFNFLPAYVPPGAAGNFYEYERLDSIQPIFVTATTTIARCFGSATGAIGLGVSGGNTRDYTFAWADGPTTRERQDLAAGAYTVTVTEAAGASETLRVEVGQNTRIEVFINLAGGDVELRASGGQGPYYYDWDDGAEGASRQGLAPATYPCLVSDALGCSTRVNVVVDPSSFYFAGNPILLPLDAGDAYRADPTTKPNLSFACEVWVEQDYLSGEFARLGTLLEQPADRAGRTTFEVQELLAPYLDYHVPAPDQRGVVRATPLFRRFYLRYYEQFGQPAQPAPGFTQAQHYALLGGLDFYESRARTWFNSYQAGAQPFFTWEPNDKLVAADQPEFLYFMAPGGPLLRQVLVRYEDGTSAARPPAAPAAECRRYELHCWAVGFAALELADAPGRRVAGWDVWLSDGAGQARTEVRRFRLDQRRPAQRRYFLFATSLGGMATFVATGEAQLDAEVSGDEAERPLPPDYDPLRGDVVVQDRSLRPVLKLASGFRSRAQMAAAQDLLLSRRVLLLNGPRWLPGFFRAKTVQVREDGKSLPTLELDFYLPRQRYYTPRLPLTAAGQPVLPIANADQFLP